MHLAGSCSPTRPRWIDNAEASYAGFPMSQFDKDDVEDLGLLKLDVLASGCSRRWRARASRDPLVDGVEIDLDDEGHVPFDDDYILSMIPQGKTRCLRHRVAGSASRSASRGWRRSATSSPTSRCSGPAR